MMSGIGKEQYEREVLYSVLKDSANSLIRTELRDRGLLEIDTALVDWSERLVLEYLPSMVAAMPLSEAVVEPGSSRDGVSFWLRLRHEASSPAIGAFLRWFLGRATATRNAHPDATGVAPEVLDQIAERVARNWQSTEF